MAQMLVLDQTIKDALAQRVAKLEAHFKADAVFYYGPIYDAVLRTFRDFVEQLAVLPAKSSRLVFFLNSPGGSAETAEKMVDIIRFHYSEVWFVVPDAAMSAGTILCMSGDKIFMDYSSSLGPIDPQVNNGKEWVPALGYLEKVAALIEKSRNGTITHAEFTQLQNTDLALLSSFEQARDLTVTLLKKWLVDYKFRDWTTHRTDPLLLGQAVTQDQKLARAEEIARKLGDTKRWHSHGRMIGPATLKNALKLEIDDYSTDVGLRSSIREYNDLLTDYIVRHNHQLFMHHREYF